MANPSGRPNISNPALDENGNFSTVWYKFFIQMWIRSGGAEDDVGTLFEQVNLAGLKAYSEPIESGDLSPSVIEAQQQGDLSPITQQIHQASLSDLAPV